MSKTPEQQAQEYAPNDKLREYLAITTPEDKAAEWVSRRVEFSGEDESPNISHLIDKELKVAFLAGHAAGKQEAEQRIWAKFVSWMTGPPDDRRLRIVSDELKRIIFGDEKV